MDRIRYYAFSALAVIVCGLVIHLVQPDEWRSAVRDVGEDGAVVLNIFLQLIYAVLSLPGQVVGWIVSRPFTMTLLDRFVAALLIALGANLGVGLVVESPVHLSVPFSLIAAWSLLIYLLFGAAARSRRKRTPGA